MSVHEKCKGGIFLDKHTEATERYCHVIGRNTPVMKTHAGGETVYECMNRHICEKNGGCTNPKYSAKSAENDGCSK